MNNEICIMCHKSFPAYDMWFFPRFEQYACEKDYGKYTSMIQECDEK